MMQKYISCKVYDLGLQYVVLVNSYKISTKLIKNALVIKKRFMIIASPYHLLQSTNLKLIKKFTLNWELHNDYIDELNCKLSKGTTEEQIGSKNKLNNKILLNQLNHLHLLEENRCIILKGWQNKLINRLT